jgi:hypothetical protein
MIDIVVGAGASNPNNFTNVNNTLFFQATVGASGAELWNRWNDGGDGLGQDIFAGVTAHFKSLTNVGTHFPCQQWNNGLELWKSNGTAGERSWSRTFGLASTARIQPS